MTVQDRERQLRVVAEILLIHLPGLLKSDPPLARDLLAVAGTALHDIHNDAERSRKAWDKRTYHVRADELEREWAWALGAANYATGLALRPQPPTLTDLEKLRTLIGPEIQKPARRQIKEPARFRGAAQAVKIQQANKKRPVRG